MINKMRIDILTLFPGMFKNILEQSILKRAIEDNLVKVNLYNLRDYTHDTHRTADDRPFGGGPGMVMKPEPIFEAVEDILNKAYSLELKANSINRQIQKTQIKIILLTPSGKKLNQKMLIELSKYKHLILICGHYEGIDERVREYVATDEISIGDYILTCGEIPVMVLIDGIIRLIPKVLGNEKSHSFESFQNNLLEYPQYTRPANYRSLKVPEILLSGDHNKINNWRRKKALERTAKLRPALIRKEEDKDG